MSGSTVVSGFELQGEPFDTVMTAGVPPYKTPVVSLEYVYVWDFMFIMRRESPLSNFDMAHFDLQDVTGSLPLRMIKHVMVTMTGVW